jgi:two-component system CAI-1 autoinducer sensor kinase/phosphatase CqsS
MWQEAINCGAALFSRTQGTIRESLLQYERQYDHITTRFVMLAWVGVIGLPLYWLVWAYVFPQGYENLPLRLLGVALCLPAVLARGRLAGPGLSAYLVLATGYVLPFLFTFMFLMNGGGAVWGQSLLVALTVLFHFPTLWACGVYLAGTFCACVAFSLVGDARLLLDRDILAQLPVHLFAILVVSIAKVGRRMLAQEKLAGMAQGLATVSHELRTPLVSVEANVRGVNRLLHAQQGPASWNAAGEAMARIQHEVRHMNQLIDLFLLSATAVQRNLKANEELSMRKVVEAVIQRYPFATADERALVAIDVRADFTFSGTYDLSVVVLLNLLRNALKALRHAGKGRIRIVIDGERARPRLLFIDTGCGIEVARLPLIFKRFYSYPANTGSGIGLALCREIVEAWKASIRCVSRENAYTAFILEFPTSACQAAPAMTRTPAFTPI